MTWGIPFTAKSGFGSKQTKRLHFSSPAELANFSSPGPPPTMLIMHTLTLPSCFFANSSNFGAVPMDSFGQSHVTRVPDSAKRSETHRLILGSSASRELICAHTRPLTALRTRTAVVPIPLEDAALLTVLHDIT